MLISLLSELWSSGSSDEILNSNSRDAGIDQIVPLERVGKEYLFIRAQGEDENERLINCSP